MSGRDSSVGPTCQAQEASPGAVLAVLVAGTVLAPLDSSIVNIALPTIAAQFGESMAEVGWVASAYLLTSAALLLALGRVGDLWGLRRLYVTGLLVFGGGSVFCALSPSLALLVGSRVVQAVGAAMLFAAGPALVTRTFPPNRRGWALGYISLSVAVGLTLGPTLGGVLVQAFGWPSIFLINVPLAAIAAVFAQRLLPSECPLPSRFDVFGSVLAATSLLLFLLGLGEAERFGLLSVRVIVPAIAASGLLAAFVIWERRTPHPVVDVRLFRSRTFSTGIAAACIAYLSLFALTFTLPFFLQRAIGMSPGSAGALLTVTPLAMAVFAPIAGRISDRSGSRGVATVGISVLAAGLFAASLLTPRSGVLVVAACLLLVGAGMALFQTPNTAAILRAIPLARAGVGSAFVAEARNLGMALGIAITAAIVGSSVGAAGLPRGESILPPAVLGRFMVGMADALRFGAALAASGAVLSWYGHDARMVEEEAATP